MKFINADQRLAEKSGAKILIVGPSGVGKTSLLRTMPPAMLASTLFVDIEAGDIAVADLPVASVRPRRWEECRDLACPLGGFNPALPATAAYSEAHFNEVMKNPGLSGQGSFRSARTARTAQPWCVAREAHRSGPAQAFHSRFTRASRSNLEETRHGSL